MVAIEVGLERRATPRQARARDRVEAILTAARSIIEKDGVEPLSTQRIAQVAGIPVGSVYQFFPNKHSIVLELAKRSLVPMNALVDRTSPAPASGDDWCLWWEHYLDSLVEMWNLDSSGGAIWSACAGTPELFSRASELEYEYARGLAGLLSPLFAHDPYEAQERRAVVLARMIAFGLDCAWHGGSWDEASAAIVKRAAIAALGAEIQAARLAPSLLS